MTFRSISIHALREEGDCAAAAARHQPGHFYPRPPRGGRHADGVASRLRKGISIHALREEGDVATLLRIAKAQNISIHALREEGDWSACPQF